MIQPSNTLSNKIKIVDQNHKPKSKKQLYFYINYSGFILKALKKASFQNFLCQMLSSENITENKINTINIKLYPDITKNGLNAVGRCNTQNGKILIYPKNFYFCNQLKKKLGKEVLLAFVKHRAKATLMHELLHLKYVSDEKKVRELTNNYFCAYIEKQFNPNPNQAFIHSLIFNTQKHSKLQAQ